MSSKCAVFEAVLFGVALVTSSTRAAARPLDSTRVYNLEVATHNYFADDAHIFAHNSSERSAKEQRLLHEKTQQVTDAAQRIDAAREALGISAPKAFTKLARTVVIIASASRSGSSAVREWFQESEGLVHLQGELGFHLELAKAGYPFNGTGSDVMTAEHVRRTDISRLDTELALDAGNRGEAEPLKTDEDKRRFAAALFTRLTLQWPKERFDANEMRTTLESTMEKLGWHNEFPDPQRFYALFLRLLSEQHPNITPYYYDIPKELIREYWGDIPAPRGPPPNGFIEVPPFITISPWKSVTQEQLESGIPVVLKQPGSSYRLAYLRALFPHAKFKVLHLVRHPARSIKGIMDGWRYETGFFRYAIPFQLDIQGYNSPWWNFDLPPNAEEMAHSCLAEVAAFQWYEANRAIVEYASANPEVDYVAIKFEDLLDRPDENTATIRDWLQLPGDPALSAEAFSALRPVMATAPPDPNRWMTERTEIEPVLKRDGIQNLMRVLGYEPTGPREKIP